jgi:hypothetical protein
VFVPGRAVGLDDQPLIRPAEVRHAGVGALVDERLDDPAALDQVQNRVLELRARGRVPVGEDAREILPALAPPHRG